MNKIEQRKETITLGLTSKESRRKRDDTNVRLRKQARDEQVKKKRECQVYCDSPFYFNLTQQKQEQEQQKNNLQLIFQGLFSSDVSVELDSVTQLRRLLSLQNDIVKEIIHTNIISKLISMLQRDQYPDIQLQATWALTNIVSQNSSNNEVTSVLVFSGIVQSFVRLLSSPHMEIWNQVCWGLGNIAGDRIEFRDLVIAHGALHPIMRQFNKASSINITKNIAWVLSNLCRGKPHPNTEHLKTMLFVFSQLVFSNDSEVLTDACWGLCYISEGGQQRIQDVIDSFVVPRLIELLYHTDVNVQIPALRTLGNLATGDENQTQKLLEFDILSALKHLLFSRWRSIRKEVCWTISNFTAGITQQIQTVIASNIIPSIICCMNSGEFEIVKEATWVIRNITTRGNPEQICYLVSKNVIQVLSSLLNNSDVSLLGLCLEAIMHILRAGEIIQVSKNLDSNPHTDLFGTAGGIDRIESLQNHLNKSIYEKARAILETYCEIIDEDYNNNNNILLLPTDGNNLRSTSSSNSENGVFRFGLVTSL